MVINYNILKTIGKILKICKKKKKKKKKTKINTLNEPHMPTANVCTDTGLAWPLRFLFRL